MDTPPLPPVLPPTPPAVRPPLSASVGFKLFAIGALTLLLWLALFLVDGVRRERLGFRTQAEAEIAQTWGGEQVVAGPLLAVPYTYTAKTVREVASARGQPVRVEEVQTQRTWAYFLPAELLVEGELDPALRHRGIFTVPVYVARLQLRGRFQLDPSALGVEGATYDWARARLVLTLAQPRGLRAAPAVTWAGTPVTLAPGPSRESWSTTLEAPVPVAPENPLGAVDFTVGLTLQGSASLALVPVGAQSTLVLQSSWPDPSFSGASLPVKHAVTPQGFTATWEHSYFGRGYPQQWSEGTVTFAALANSASSVRLLQPVDAYRLVERALKYGGLFLVLVFANFFLFEVTARLRIHPLQYLMVGVALVLFFLGYLALSEFLAAGLAYGVAAVVSTLLVTAYSASALKTGRRSLVVGGTLAGTYAYLYFVLQLQDYALLAGTVALFVLLGVAMWATRKIDWYGTNPGR